MTEIRVVSYNVRYANRNDHHDAWHERRDAVARLVRFHRPDVVTFQEPVAEQRRDLRERLPEYAFVGRGRDDDGDGEGCPIGVRTDRLRITDHGTFWLSETPGSPSTDWGATHPRIATWARVQPASDRLAETKRDTDRGTSDGGGCRAFLVANTHFDHVSTRARRESARLLRRRLPEIAGDADGTITGAEADRPLPVVLCGDLNCTPESDPHQILTGRDDGSESNADEIGGRDGVIRFRDAAAAADLRHGPATSLTDFAQLIDSRRIDHVLVSPAVDVEAFATLTDRDDRGRYPSDHLPVLAKVTLPTD